MAVKARLEATEHSLYVRIVGATLLVAISLAGAEKGKAEEIEAEEEEEAEEKEEKAEEVKAHVIR